MKLSQKLLTNQRISIPIPENPIFEYSHRFVFLGSCFSNEMHQRLEAAFIDTSSNPFGTLFSPSALKKTTDILAGNCDENIVLFEDHYHCLDFDSSFVSDNLNDLHNRIKAIKTEWKHKIQNAHHLTVTLGTAFVYRHLESNENVGNCHKIPSTQFSKILLSAEEIQQSCSRMVQNLKTINPALRITFTISPVRHLRDGILENSLSKSTLKVGLHSFLNQHSDIQSFPSFEIFNEELRNTEYFAPDLAHPNTWSTDYIFYRWIETYGTPEFLNYMEAAQKLRKNILHRPKSTDAASLKTWESMLAKLKLEFLKRYPGVKLQIG